MEDVFEALEIQCKNKRTVFASVNVANNLCRTPFAIVTHPLAGVKRVEHWPRAFVDDACSDPEAGNKRVR